VSNYTNTKYLWDKKIESRIIGNDVVSLKIALIVYTSVLMAKTNRVLLKRQVFFLKTTHSITISKSKEG